MYEHIEMGHVVGKSVRDLIGTYQAVAGVLTSRLISEGTRKQLEALLVHLDREILEAQIREEGEHDIAA
jgi:hypothetical protein